MVGFNDNYIEYFQGFLSQFVHGLCLSNMFVADSEQMKRILYESIPIAARFIQAIYQTFNDKEMMTHFLSSENINLFLNSKDFNYVVKHAGCQRTDGFHEHKEIPPTR